MLTRVDFSIMSFRKPPTHLFPDLMCLGVAAFALLVIHRNHHSEVLFVTLQRCYLLKGFYIINHVGVSGDKEKSLSYIFKLQRNCSSKQDVIEGLSLRVDQLERCGTPKRFI